MEDLKTSQRPPVFSLGSAPLDEDGPLPPPYEAIVPSSLFPPGGNCPPPVPPPPSPCRSLLSARAVPRAMSAPSSLGLLATTWEGEGRRG